MDWKQEAQKQAAIAGEYRIRLTARLDYVKESARRTMKQLQEEADLDTQMKLHLKITLLREQEAWLEQILYDENLHKGAGSIVNDITQPTLMSAT